MFLYAIIGFIIGFGGAFLMLRRFDSYNVFTRPSSNWTAVVDPTAANDNTQGYGAGSHWLNTALNKEWTCYTAGTGAAVWHYVTLT